MDLMELLQLMVLCFYFSKRVMAKIASLCNKNDFFFVSPAGGSLALVAHDGGWTSFFCFSLVHFAPQTFLLL